jgi:hypothetical protein
MIGRQRLPGALVVSQNKTRLSRIENTVGRCTLSKASAQAIHPRAVQC